MTASGGRVRLEVEEGARCLLTIDLIAQQVYHPSMRVTVFLPAAQNSSVELN
jgi:hypothetical protein